MKHKGGILLNILTPEKNLAGHMVGQVKLPGTAGEFTVLSGHAPLITSKSVHIRSGFAEVQNDTVSACVEI